MEDKELEVQESVSVQTETVTSVEKEKETKLDDLPRIEELRKSEKEVSARPEVEGVTQVEKKKQVEDRFFTKKKDQKQVLMKKRLKIVTSVYVSVVALMLAFVGVNIATLAILNKQVTTNTNTIQTQQVQVEVLEEANPGIDPSGEIQISLNEPRDYSDDKKELTFLDKLTILFRNLFA